jgi:hypothetical protein
VLRGTLQCICDTGPWDGTFVITVGFNCSVAKYSWSGLKKRDSIEARLKYADEIMEDILDSANEPVTGKRWYLQVREPLYFSEPPVQIFMAFGNRTIVKSESRFKLPSAKEVYGTR